jgi:hypothetical protein
MILILSTHYMYTDIPPPQRRVKLQDPSIHVFQFYMPVLIFYMIYKTINQSYF